MRSSVKLGDILGIPFLINYSWFVIFIIVTVSLALFYFPSALPNWQTGTYWVMGIVASLLFFGSVLGHELAHSLVAKSQDIPVKSITLFVFGGVSRITKEASTPLKEAVLAAAGPLSSVVFGGVFILVWFLTQNVSQPVAQVCFYLGYINFLLAAFNLIPGFPMDGGRVFRSFVWWITKNYKRATHIAAVTGQGIAFAFIIGGVLSIFLIPGFLINGIWFAVIGWFLENAASASYRQVQLKDALHGFKASDVMSQDCALVPPSLNVRTLVNEYVLRTSQRCFLVSEGEKMQGLVTLQDIKRVSQDSWDTNNVTNVMTPLEKLKWVAPDEDAYTLLEQMDENDIAQMPVVDKGKVVGMIGRDNIIRFIRSRSEVGM